MPLTAPAENVNVSGRPGADNSLSCGYATGVSKRCHLFGGLVPYELLSDSRYNSHCCVLRDLSVLQAGEHPPKF